MIEDIYREKCIERGREALQEMESQREEFENMRGDYLRDKMIDDEWEELQNNGQIR